MSISCGWEGRGRYMAHFDCGWACGCAGKTVKSLENTCHNWALLRWWFTTKRRYIKCMHLCLCLYVPFACRVIRQGTRLSARQLNRVSVHWGNGEKCVFLGRWGIRRSAGSRLQFPLRHCSHLAQLGRFLSNCVRTRRFQRFQGSGVADPFKNQPSATWMCCEFGFSV